MSSKRLSALIAGLVIVSVVTLRVVAGSRGGSDAAVDLTRTTPSPVLAQVQPPTMSVADKPLLVLSQRVVRHGESIVVWGGGFPGGASVNIYLKERASDNVNPVSVVEADQSGKFGGVSLTVPSSLAGGSFIIQARENQGGSSVLATATMLDDLDEQEVHMQATTTAQPSPAATATRAATVVPTATPKATPQRQPSPTSRPTDQPSPTQQPQPSGNPTPTPQLQQTAQPQPAPETRPTEQPQPKPETPSSSYRVDAGDSLSAIAERVYGDPNKWKSLYDANRGAIGSNPNLIHPGTELIIPPQD